MSENVKRKLGSRKFWICIAAFLGSVAMSINGMATSDRWITVMGMFCGVVSAGIYAAVEAWTDSSHKGEQ